MNYNITECCSEPKLNDWSLTTCGRLENVRRPLKGENIVQNSIAVHSREGK